MRLQREKGSDRNIVYKVTNSTLRSGGNAALDAIANRLELAIEQKLDSEVLLRSLFKAPKGISNQVHQRSVINELEAKLLHLLSDEMREWTWGSQVRFSSKRNVRDKADICTVKDGMVHNVVIEFDKHRADQVAKKYLSRHALMVNKPLLYVAFCYPGTENMSVNECKKYFNYCAALSDAMTLEGKEKYFLGYIL